MVAVREHRQDSAEHRVSGEQAAPGRADRCRSEGDGVPAFWQNLGTYDPAIWIPIAALVTQITVATVVTILVLRWQERAALGRNRAVR